MKLINRPLFIKRAKRLLESFPVLAILGPRQCGKTTLVKNYFPEFEYLDLEKPSDFQKIEHDPELYSF